MSSTSPGTAGSLVGAAGAVAQGQAQSAALDAQANVQKNNAQQDIAAGHSNATRIQIVGQQREGHIAGAAAASGVTMSGSVLNVMAASSLNNELDRQNILHGAELRATNAENQAIMDELGAKSALQGSYYNALSSLIGGTTAYHGASGAEDQTAGDGAGAEEGGAGAEGGGGEAAASEGGGEAAAAAAL